MLKLLRMAVFSFIVIMILSSCRNQIVVEDIVYKESYAIPPLDILFVIDDSNSMAVNPNRTDSFWGPNYDCDDPDSKAYGSKLCRMADVVEEFILAYTEDSKNMNYRIGITTTLADGELETDVITSSLGQSQVIASLENAIKDLVWFASENPNTVERGLSAAANAVYYSADFNRTNFLHQGWYTGGHDLAVIILSDEDDSSGNACSSPENCLTWFKGAKSPYPGTRTSFHAIADYHRSCHVGPESAPKNTNIEFGAEKYFSMVQLTDGEFAPMCEPKTNDYVVNISNNFDTFFRNIGKNLRATFPLAIYPDIDDLKVSLDNIVQILGEDYVYDKTKNAIVFLEGHYPGHGQNLEIKYKMGEGR